MNEEIKPKGTSWKRRRNSIVAGVTLVALSALGSTALIGNANAGTTTTKAVPTAEPTGPVTMARSGWGG